MVEHFLDPPRALGILASLSKDNSGAGKRRQASASNLSILVRQGWPCLPSSYDWLRSLSHNPVLRHPTRVSWAVTGLQVELEPSYKYPGPPSTQEPRALVVCLLAVLANQIYKGSLTRVVLIATA